jgi:hypothetical protein
MSPAMKTMMMSMAPKERELQTMAPGMTMAPKDI